MYFCKILSFVFEPMTNTVTGNKQCIWTVTSSVFMCLELEQECYLH